MITKIIRFLYYTLFLATPLIMYSKTSELFEFNKMLFIYFITTLIVALWIIKTILYRGTITYRAWFTVFGLFFLATQIFSTVFSIDKHTSLFGYYGRFNGGLFSIIAYLALFFVAWQEFDRKHFITLLKISVVSSLFVMLWALPGKLGHDMGCLAFTGQWTNSCWSDQFHPSERIFSTLGQPNWLGAYLSIHFFIALYFLFHLFSHHHHQNSENEQKNNTIHRLYTAFMALYLFLSFSCILFTRSRSAFIATVVGLILFPLFLLVIHKKEWFKQQGKNYLLVGILCILAIILFQTGISQVDKYLRPFSKQPAIQNVAPVTQYSSEVTESLDIRKIVWKGALQLAQQYPIFGTGVETFGYAYYFTRPIEHNLTSEWDFLYNKAHNEYLNYLATTGYVGFASYLLLILGTIFLLAKKIFMTHADGHDDRLLYVCLLLSYISILITNFFGFSTTTINLFFYLIPAMALFTAKPSAVLVKQPTRLSQKLQIGIAIIGVIFIGQFLVRYFLADMSYESGDLATRTGEYQQAAISLEKALGLHYEHVYEDKLSYALANVAFIAAYQGNAKQDKSTSPPDLAKKLIDLANYYNTSSLQASPKNILYWKTKAKNEYVFYQIDLDKQHLIEGIRALTTAQKLAPTDPKIPYSIALFYSLLADEEDKNSNAQIQYQNQALQAIDSSIQLKPNYRDAYFLKAQLLEKFGQKETARSVLEFILQKIDKNDQEVQKELENLR